MLKLVDLNDKFNNSLEEKRYLKSNRTNKYRPNEPTYDLQEKGNK